MIKHVRIFALPIAACALLLSAGLNADDAVDQNKEVLSLSELDLTEKASDNYFGDGWYGALGLYSNAICETNPTIWFCITALDAPVIEVPFFGGFGGGGEERRNRRHHRRHHERHPGGDR